MAENSTVTKVQKKKYDNQTLSECIKKLYLDSETADVNFTIESEDGSTERVPAHRSLLAAVSDVFKAMFYGDLKEDGDVRMSDVTAAALKEFLQFFYLEQIELTEANIVEVMHLGHKYNVIKCEEICVRFLKDNLNDDNICTALSLAILYDKNELIQLCEEHIVVSTSAVFKSSCFLECDKRVLEHILKMNLLSCPETEVFEACMAWVKVRSKQDVLSKELVQEHLGDLFYQIRFTSMAVEDSLALYLSHKNLFSSDEFEDIIRAFTPSRDCPKLFNGNSRQARWNEDAVIVCDRKVLGAYHDYYVMPSIRNTKFSSTEPILLGGFVCAKITTYYDRKLRPDVRSDLPTDVKVTVCSDGSNTKTLSNVKANLISESETVILLPKPVFIRPGQFYEIHMSQSPDGHCYYGSELRSEVSLESDITIKFHNDHKVDNRKRSIPPKIFIVNLVASLLFNKI